MISVANSLAAFYRSSIGKKLVVALTGLALIGFLFGHMAGNLKIYLGSDKLNSYAAWLHSMPVTRTLRVVGALPQLYWPA